MQAPTLSQTQMRKALKKKIAKKSIRNVLSKPTTSIWYVDNICESWILVIRLTILGLKSQHLKVKNYLMI